MEKTWQLKSQLETAVDSKNSSYSSWQKLSQNGKPFSDFAESIPYIQYNSEDIQDPLIKSLIQDIEMSNLAQQHKVLLSQLVEKTNEDINFVDSLYVEMRDSNDDLEVDSLQNVDDLKSQFIGLEKQQREIGLEYNSFTENLKEVQDLSNEIFTKNSQLSSSMKDTYLHMENLIKEMQQFRNKK